MIRTKLAALAAGLLACVPAAAQNVGTLPPAAPLTGTERIASVQGAGCPTKTSPCAAVSITPALLSTFLAPAFQPRDADLDAIAALSTADFGRQLLTRTDAASTRSAIGLGSVDNTPDASKAVATAGSAARLTTARTINGVAFDGTGNITINAVDGDARLLVSANLSDLNNAATARGNLGLGSLALQSTASVAITGGSITGITDLAVADGGTGASTAATARTNLGLGSLATQNASGVSITGGTITGITDLAIADGGTAASTAAAARANLGISTIVHPGYVASRWYWASTTPTVYTTLSANQIRLTPFVLTQAVTLNSLASRIGTAATGNLQLAIYASDATTKMPAALVTSSPSIATSTTGAVAGTLSTNASLQPGLYWQAVNVDNGTVAVQASHPAYGIQTNWLVGSATLANLGTADKGSIILFINQSFGTWPSTLTGANVAEFALEGPVIGFRVASVP